MSQIASPDMREAAAGQAENCVAFMCVLLGDKANGYAILNYVMMRNTVISWKMCVFRNEPQHRSSDSMPFTSAVSSVESALSVY